MPPNVHHWNFFRAGGFDQARLDTGADIAHLAHLDQKLWVALACPTKGLEFDPKTLEFLDTDHDGRIRAPEIIAAAEWTTGLLKNPDDLVHSKPALPLAAINDQTPEGKQLLSSAKQILLNLGKKEAAEISPEDTADTVRIFANTQFNGDGIIPPDAASDPGLQAIITEIITTLGSDTDRSGKPGTDQKKVDLFFAEAQAFAGWHDQLAGGDGGLPLGANSVAAAATIKTIFGKVEDFFTRCRLAAFDARSTEAANRAEADYASLATKDLTAAAAEIAAFPISRISPGAALPLSGNALNPAWRQAVEAFAGQVVTPVLGARDTLAEADWAALIAKFAPVDAWLAAKAGAKVEPLGLDRVRAILAANVKPAIDALIAQDQALEPEATSIAAVDRLVHYHRDLYHLLNNFVSFRDFYARRGKAVFQVGTLYLDQRACELCVRVDDPPRHALLAHLSRSYLAYCDLARKQPDGSLEKLSIAAAFTAGDSDNLMVGRNGIFYDRQGRDWDATITRITENPISIRQAFFSPYKRVLRFISDQVAKRAAAADQQATERLQNAAAAGITSVAKGAPPPPTPPAPAKSKIDIGTLAAIGLVLTSIVGFMSGLFVGFLSLGVYMPLGLLVLLLLISGPSMLIAWFKLRQRNLGPILDANGWAVNSKAKLNIPFGRSLTHTPKLPPHSHRNLIDPYAESHKVRNWTIVVILVLAALLGLWYFGFVERALPNVFPPSNYMIRQHDQEQAAAEKAASDRAAAEEKREEKAGPGPRPETQPGPGTTRNL